jgi:hypothetical protein
MPAATEPIDETEDRLLGALSATPRLHIVRTSDFTIRGGLPNMRL